MNTLLKRNLPTLGAIAAGTAFIGYIYYVHAMMVPKDHQEPVAVQVAAPTDETIKQDVEDANAAFLNSLAMMQTTEAIMPVAMVDASEPTAVEAPVYGEPGPVAQVAPQTPVANQGYFVNELPAPPPSQPLYNPPFQPLYNPPTQPQSSMVVYVQPPPPQQEDGPGVVTPGYYWSAGYWSPSGNGFKWTKGQMKPTPAAYISNSSEFVSTSWVQQGSSYVLVPGYWINQPANSIQGNTLPGAASLIKLPTSTFPKGNTAANTTTTSQTGRSVARTGGG